MTRRLFPRDRAAGPRPTGRNLAPTLRTMPLVLALAALAVAASLPEWYSREVRDAEFQARLVRDAAEIERLAGDRFEGDVILVELRMRPLYGSAIELDRSDFLLRARNRNDMSPAVSPDRVAGSAVLALGTKPTSSGGSVFAEPAGGPVWGGAPGTGTRPRRLGAPPAVVGGGAQGEGRQTVDARRESDTPVLTRLRELELPLAAKDSPVSGYLYFEIPARTKRKHLELSYDGNLGDFLIEFKRPE